MVTVLREAGMRFVIYTDDHEPAHTHVYGDGEARINILDLTVLSNRGMKKRDLSVALAIVQANKRLFIEKWESIHG
ncbi:DUF4160 domain-containing protein [Rhizobium sp. ZPR3]|uniref:DUF4160 domain-containing protein n=2 Tax=unclassified Rhizobium TaxID=2613769 RepID=A0AAU7SPS6_9HYPH